MRLFSLASAALLAACGCSCRAPVAADAGAQRGARCVDAGPLAISIHESVGASSSVAAFSVEEPGGTAAWVIVATDGGTNTYSLVDSCSFGERLLRELPVQRSQRVHILGSVAPAIVSSATPDGVETRVDLFGEDSGVRFADCTSVSAPAEVARLASNSAMFLPGLCADSCGASRLFFFSGGRVLGRQCLPGSDDFGWVPSSSLAAYSTSLLPGNTAQWRVFVSEFEVDGTVRQSTVAVSAVPVQGFVSSRSFLSWVARDPRAPFAPSRIQVATLVDDGGLALRDDTELGQVVPIPEVFVDSPSAPVVLGLQIDGGEALAVMSGNQVVRSAVGSIAREWGLARHRAALSNGLLCRIARGPLDGGVSYSLVCE